MLNIDLHIFEAKAFLLKAYAAHPTEELKELILFSPNIPISSEKSSTANNEELHFKSNTGNLFFSTSSQVLDDWVADKDISAAKRYDGLAQKFPELCIINKIAGDLWLSAKKRKRAEKSYYSALQCNDQMKYLHRSYAGLVLDHDCRTAVRHFLISIEVDGESMASYDGLVRCYDKLGDKVKKKEYSSKFRELFFRSGGKPLDFFFSQSIR